MDEPGQQELAGLVRLRLDLGYDGSAFHGWARQPGLRSVQETVESALSVALSLPVSPALTVAGRTDAGVHARGQVAHVDIPVDAWAQAAGSAARRLARLLPEDVLVRSIAPAPVGFDARFAALWRRYSYRVCDDPTLADPLRRHDTLRYRRPLNLSLMNEAARACLGEHDFAAFCRRRDGATTIRELLRLDWVRAAPGVAVATVTADAFCHNMVRALVGALLSVGDGSRPASWLAEVLAARRRDPAVRVAPAHPLCLEEVGYPDPPGLAARAALTRRTRELHDQDETGALPDAADRRPAAARPH
ncbi:MAG TPA: tRNA pseudouridine(38-40) synthase TruA [Streptosporangiaceae bacterium]|nr:tRNA pseudouridine(38-40) synthase TruA [Streptosporangiaceae bacterium]